MLDRVLAVIRPGFVTELPLEPRMSSSQVLAAVADAVGPRPPGQELTAVTLRRVDGQLVWSVSVMTRGASASVTVDDATGAVGPLAHHGLR